METHELTSAQPFDFHKSLGFLCSFPPTRGEQAVDGGALTKAFSIDGRAVVARATCAGDRVRVSGERAVVERVRFQLGLDDDVAGFYARARNDVAYRPLIEQLHGLRHVKFGSGPFEAAVWAVLTQRTRIPIARAAKDRLVAALGPSTEAFGAVHRAFPEPAAILDAGFERVASLIGARAPAVIEIARAFAAVDERFLREGPFDDVESWLRVLPRIGPWSASFVLFRALGRMDKTPIGVGPIARAAQKVYGGTEKQALARADGYGEHRGYWCYYLRAALG